MSAAFNKLRWNETNGMLCQHDMRAFWLFVWEIHWTPAVYTHKGPFMRSFDVFSLLRAEDAVEQTDEFPVVRDSLILIWRRSARDWNTIFTTFWKNGLLTLHWRHNDYDGVSNHQSHGCLLNRLFRRRPKKTPKLRVTGLCVGNSQVNFPHKGPVARKIFPFDDVIMAIDYIKSTSPPPEHRWIQQRKMYSIVLKLPQ